LHDFGLVEAFEGKYVLRFGFCADHVDAAEFAFAQGTPDVERA
jgi:hypothetical protein